MTFVRLLILRIAMVFAIILATVSLSAREWTADDIPMVHLQDSRRYVCDPDGLLSQSARSQSDSCLARLDKRLGVQSVFIVVKRIKGGNCFRMAEDVGNKYGVGDKDTRKGLVVVIAVLDKHYFIAPGKGLEAELTDVDCDDIARKCIVRNMRKNNINAAVLETAKAISNRLETLTTASHTLSQSTGESDDNSTWPIIIAILALCFGYPVYLLVRYILVSLGIIKGHLRNHDHGNKHHYHNRDDCDDGPTIFFGGGGFGGGSSDGISGGSFGGGSFGGGGAGGSW